MHPIGNELLAKVFQKRGYDPNFLLDIDCAEHGEMTNARKLCELLHGVHESGEEIVFLPDFDMDGIMSGVIGLAGLRELGFNSDLFVPDPKDGYGFTPATIDRLIAIYPDVRHIITGDVGITCNEGIAHAVEKGITVYVTDHHMPGTELPDAAVIVDPMCPDSTYIHPKICGAYVVYQCMCLYAHMYGDRMVQERIHRLRVFAGIGTVSDRMPLLYENRQVVRDSVGISKFLYCDGDPAAANSVTGSPAYMNAFKGLHYTYAAFAEAGKLQDSENIDEDFYGFYLAPTFNSIKRLDGDMHEAFNVFFGVHPEESIRYLIQLNDERKNIVEEYFQEIMDSTQPYAPLAYIIDAPSGVVGLLAQKIMSITRMPTLVLHEVDGELRGSGRCPEWFDFIETARPVGGYFAGHKSAFGCHFADEEELKAVLDTCNQALTETLSEIDITEEPDVYIDNVTHTGDAELDVAQLMDFVQAVRRYRPFGMGFAEPVIKIRLRVRECDFKVIGSEQKHVKVFLPHGVEALCWNQSSKLSDIEHSETFTLTGTFEINDFAGRNTLALKGDMTC
ncbi:MAG: hypothetical protein HDQ88_04485 [Clostridia bacterium]|nr:hypothetical protein [Clostridia bacterium]